MKKTVTVRLDEADYTALQQQADRLRVRPGTLARMLVHTGLTANASAAGNPAARAALDRLVQRSRQRAPADAVGLVVDARHALDPDRRASSSGTGAPGLPA